MQGLDKLVHAVRVEVLPGPVGAQPNPERHAVLARLEAKRAQKFDVAIAEFIGARAPTAQVCDRTRLAGARQRLLHTGPFLVGARRLEKRRHPGAGGFFQA